MGRCNEFGMHRSNSEIYLFKLCPSFPGPAELDQRTPDGSPCIHRSKAHTLVVVSEQGHRKSLDELTTGRVDNPLGRERPSQRAERFYLLFGKVDS